MTDALMDQTSEAKRTALGTLLIERGYIDQEQLDEALRRSAENGERLGEVIVKLGWASEDDLAKVLAEQWHLRYYERSAISFDGKALRRMSWEDASRLEALPIQENDEGEVVVAVAEPTDARLLALRELLGDRIDFVVAHPSIPDRWTSRRGRTRTRCVPWSPGTSAAPSGIGPPTPQCVRAPTGATATASVRSTFPPERVAARRTGSRAEELSADSPRRPDRTHRTSTPAR